MVWFPAFVIAIQSFVSGFATGALNSCLKEDATGSILIDLPMTKSEQQLATAITTGAIFSLSPRSPRSTLLLSTVALVASFLMSYFIKFAGYRSSIIFGCFITIISGVLCGFSNKGFAYLVVGRAFLGWSVGLNSITSPVLLSEISTTDIRGKVTSLHQLLITIGILSTGLMSYGFIENTVHGWRYILVFPAVLGVLNLLLAFVLPESPVWLVHRKQEEKAGATLYKLRGGQDTYIHKPINEYANSINASNDITVATSQILSPSQVSVDAHSRQLYDNIIHETVARELYEIQAEIIREAAIQQASWLDVFASGRIFWIGVGLQFFQPLSGINALMSYSTKIFGFAGVKEDIIATVLIGALNVVMTIICMYTIEKVGRKVLIFIGTIICAVSLSSLGAVLLGMNSSPSSQGYISVGLVMVYITGFAIGLGAVSWIIMAEVTSAHIRSKAYSLFITQNWTLNLFITLFSLSLIEALGGGTSDEEQKKGVAYLFLIFAGFCTLACIFIWFVIPETKGLSSDEIADIFAKDKRKSNSRNNGVDEDDNESPLLDEQN